MKTILLIGAGNIGKRHLQGLLLSPIPYQIFIVDSSLESIHAAQDAVKEVDTSASKIHSLSYFFSIEEISGPIDIAIIATSAHVRRKVIEQLFKKVIPTFIVLEKVLFQLEEDYKAIGKLLYDNKVKAFVNCPRRYFNHYRVIKNYCLQNSIDEAAAIGTKAYSAPLIKFKVVGQHWGLACNAIHFIDLYNFLSDNIQLDLSESIFEPKIYTSKRPGFIELMGELKDEHLNFSICCNIDQGEDIIVHFQFNEFTFEINETKGVIKTEHVNIPTVAYNALPLSKMSHIFTNELLLTGICQLPSYFTSAQLHLAMLKPFKNHLEKYQPNFNGIISIT